MARILGRYQGQVLLNAVNESSVLQKADIVYINQRDAQILVNSLYFFVNWL